MHQAAHDLELASHAARVGPDRVEDLALDAEQRREALDLATVLGGHEPVGRGVPVEAVQDRVEPDVLLARQVLVEARALEDDPDEAPDGARLGDDVAAGDRRPPGRRQERGRQDRDRGRLARAVGPSRAKNSPAPTSNEIPSTAFRVALR